MFREQEAAEPIPMEYIGIRILPVNSRQSDPLNAYTYQGFDQIAELHINFGVDTRIEFEKIEQLLLMITTGGRIVGFEIIGNAGKLMIQFVCPEQSADSLASLIMAYVPGIAVNRSGEKFAASMDFDQATWVTDLGLRDEFMQPLRVWNKFDPDPLAGCIAVLESLK